LNCIIIVSSSLCLASTTSVAIHSMPTHGHRLVFYSLAMFGLTNHISHTLMSLRRNVVSPSSYKNCTLLALIVDRLLSPDWKLYTQLQDRSGVSHILPQIIRNFHNYHVTKYNMSNRKNKGRTITLLNNSTEQSPSWNANSSSAPQEMPRILRNPNVHYRVHSSPLLVPVLSQSIQFTPLPHSRRILIGSSHLRQCLPSVVFPSGFPTKSLIILPSPCVPQAPPTSSFLI
jgi:hypothetical protein